MAAGKGKEFAGQLQQPPKYSRHQLQALQSAIGFHPAAQQIYQNAVCELTCEREAKLKELGQHYGIAESEQSDGAEYYKNLALALAADFVPGFHDVPRRGRCPKWPMLAGWLLVCEMDRYIDDENSQYGMTHAATQCALKAHWRQYLEKTRITRESGTATALRQIYQAFRNSRAQMTALREMWKDSSIEEWNAYVSSTLDGI